MNIKSLFIAVLITVITGIGTAFALEVNEKTTISDVVNNPAFQNYGRLIFPVSEHYYDGDTLENLSLTWYGELNPARTVEIINYMLKQVENGKKNFLLHISRK